jgi:hypothetical protein
MYWTCRNLPTWYATLEKDVVLKNGKRAGQQEAGKYVYFEILSREAMHII